MTRLVTAIALCALALSPSLLSGCASVAGGLSSVAGRIAGPQPQQARTLAEAEQFATLATKATQAYVDAAPLSRSQLVAISGYNDALHAAIVSLEQANANGQSLSFATFNAALAAFETYKATLPRPTT